ncbi:hypothetical protein SERLA73DRAFT_78458 [Serpula lacrymans var. lacrymans S7.3]|uniref:Thioredoxin domain-containing protein n=1 Tax=Serpula lacrymans var. lacrymans (strain S7.3) TaxID=936435 RepID=F8QDA6_SERL3|nr:hypothetical protein SERLA73DRAFT_78458 [Serpula lacrymans var. lacrymans S7.3]
MTDFSAVPQANAISQAAQLEVLDANGNSVRFGSLFEDTTTIVVFIRHFFCGSCQDYVVQLASVQPEVLKAGKKVVVIGCGDWQPIQFYAETTGFQGPIFADPTRKLYVTLGMTIENLQGTPAGEKRRSYLQRGDISNALASIWRGPLKKPTLMGKQGNISQLGGEFIFGPGQQCSFAARMRHTQDHVEISDLMKAAGLEL